MGHLGHLDENSRAMMNKRDRATVERLCEENSEFAEMYLELGFLRLRVQQTLQDVHADMPTARELQEGRQPRIYVLRRKGQDTEQTIVVANTLIREAIHMAHRLSKFFPAERRDYWLEVFYAQTLGGTGTVGRGERGPIQRTKDRAELYRRLKDENPSLSQQAVARRAMEILMETGGLDPDEEITEYDVGYAYSEMGWEWERANRIR